MRNMNHLLAINGHPDPRPERFCSALCDAYLRGAQGAGWQVHRIDIGQMPLSAVHALDDCDDPGVEVAELFDQLRCCDRLAIFYPLWFDRPPQVLRLLFERWARGSIGQRRAQLAVTMDLPAFAQRSVLRSGALPALPALCLAGIMPDDPILIGSVSTITVQQRRAWLAAVRVCGEGRAGASLSPLRRFSAAIDHTVSHFALA